MSETTNLHLKKIGSDEKIVTMEYNENLDKIDQALQETFQSVSNGKSLLASAIADKGGTVAEDANWNEFVNAINSMMSSKSLTARVESIASTYQNYGADTSVSLTKEGIYYFIGIYGNGMGPSYKSSHGMTYGFGYQFSISGGIMIAFDVFTVKVEIPL